MILNHRAGPLAIGLLAHRFVGPSVILGFLAIWSFGALAHSCGPLVLWTFGPLALSSFGPPLALLFLAVDPGLAIEPDFARGIIVSHCRWCFSLASGCDCGRSCERQHGPPLPLAFALGVAARPPGHPATRLPGHQPYYICISVYIYILFIFVFVFFNLYINIYADNRFAKQLRPDANNLKNCSGV